MTETGKRTARPIATQVTEETLRADLEKYRTTTKDVIRQFGASTDMADDARLWEVTRRYGELYEEMYVRWLDETIETLEGREV